VKVAIMMCCLVLLSSTVNAAEDSFVSSSEEMIQKLSPKPPVRKTRSLHPTSGSKTSAGETRAIVRIKEDVHNQGQLIEETVQVAVVQENPHVNLKIEFDVNSSSIRPESFPLIAELGKALSSEALQEQKFQVIGHTDSDGDDKYNLELSYKRAESIREFLKEMYGLSSDRLIVLGYGESMPIASNADSGGKQKNRRVEVITMN
jgi:outer membrane protein OmpA-like peptidoglycan-associated protein